MAEDHGSSYAVVVVDMPPDDDDDDVTFSLIRSG